MTDKVRLGVVGAGALANRVHYPSLAAMPDVELVAVCDLVESKAASTAKAFGSAKGLGGAKTYTDYRAMLDSEKLDAAYVLMPPYHLFDVTMDVMERGLHVFIEKPPAVTTFQAEMLAEAAARHKVLSMVGFNRRFIPLHRLVRERLERQGPITHCVSVFYKNSPDVGYYRGAIDYLHCDAIHAVDMLRWMGGEAESVASVTHALGWTHENGCHAVARFASGATGVLMTDWVTGTRLHTFEMHGRGFSAFLNPDVEARVYDAQAPTGETIRTADAAGSDAFHIYYGFFGENRHFIDCVKAGQQPETHFAEAAKSMRLVDQLYAAAI